MDFFVLVGQRPDNSPAEALAVIDDMSSEANPEFMRDAVREHKEGGEFDALAVLTLRTTEEAVLRALRAADEPKESPRDQMAQMEFLILVGNRKDDGELEALAVIDDVGNEANPEYLQEHQQERERSGDFLSLGVITLRVPEAEVRASLYPATRPLQAQVLEGKLPDLPTGMGDRQLLELAAKGVGRSLATAFWSEKYRGFVYQGSGKLWAPLHDRADAFDLMVAGHVNLLHLSYLTPERSVQAGVDCHWPVEIKAAGSNPVLATCRAIVTLMAKFGLVRQQMEAEEAAKASSPVAAAEQEAR